MNNIHKLLAGRILFCYRNSAEERRCYLVLGGFYEKG